MSVIWRDAIERRHSELQASGLWRARKTIEQVDGMAVSVDGLRCINFASNDYLGLSKSSNVLTRSQQLASAWGNGSAASHLVSGHSALHQQLESELAEFVGAERVLLLSNGYMANLALSGALLDKRCLLLQDKLNHASLIDAAKLTPAVFKRYAHNDLAHAQRLLSTNSFDRCMIATDGVFSMDGDVARLSELKALCDPNGGLLVVDDAHGFGVLGEAGRGSLNEFDMSVSGQALMMGTLGKALGSFGAFIAGDALYIEQIIQQARSYIYTTALPPSVVSASLHALRVIVEKQGEPQATLKDNIQLFRQLAKQSKLVLEDSNTPIQPLIVGNEAATMALADSLLKEGFLVGAIRPPTVPKNTARLRITLSALHSERDIHALVLALSNLQKKVAHE